MQDVEVLCGLDSDQSQRRLDRFGPNEIETKNRRGPWRLLGAQFSDFMILVLIAAAVISGLLGEPQDAIAIIVIVLLSLLQNIMNAVIARNAVTKQSRNLLI